ncbi:MAG: VCBS repeat-containing protein [Ruminococcaceae bacterium]|nr:VCBS repeat-containing protein [Oscillospiraceae bacterium]
MKKRYPLMLISLLLILSLLSGCGCLAVVNVVGEDFKLNTLAAPAASEILPAPGAALLNCAVIYDSEVSKLSDVMVYSRLSQPTVLGMTVTPLDISQDYSLDGFNIIYLHESVIKSSAAKAFLEKAETFVSAGGAMFAPNAFYDFFPKSFLGVSGFGSFGSLPEEISTPEAGADLDSLQRVLSDYHKLLINYTNVDVKNIDPGIGIIPDTAVSLAVSGSLALSSLNKYGKGYVLLSSALLPDRNACGGLGLEKGQTGLEYFSDTSLSFARLFENAFAEFVSKRLYGFSVSRVYGSFGRPSVSLQMPIFDLESINAGRFSKFAEACIKNDLVPSYSISRNFIVKPGKHETVSYIYGDGSLSSLRSTVKDTQYSSATHVISNNSWLNRAASGNSSFAYFGLGQLLSASRTKDFVLGSEDGKIFYCAGLSTVPRYTVSLPQHLSDLEGNPLSVSGPSAPLIYDVNKDGQPDIVCGDGFGKVFWFEGNGSLRFAPRGVLVNSGINGRVFPDMGDLNSDGYTDLILGSDKGKLFAFYGTKDGLAGVSPTKIPLFGITGSWLSPRIVDLDGNGRADIAVGTKDGYIARIVSTTDGNFAASGYVELTDRNKFGNYNAFFGEYAVPVFADINDDNKLDLICSGVEGNLSYNIDSPYLSNSNPILESIAQIYSWRYYIGLNCNFGMYSSEESEREAISALLGSLRGKYNYEGSLFGVSMQERSINTEAPAGSFSPLSTVGASWATAYAPVSKDGKAYAEGVFSLPFYLVGNNAEPILLHNGADRLSANSELSQLYAKYNLPIPIYLSRDMANSYDEISTEVRLFAENNFYTAVKENQLMLATAAACNTQVSAKSASESSFDVTITASMINNSGRLYSEDYQNSAGAVISLGEALKGKNLSVDADVWYEGNNGQIFVGLNRPIRLFESEAKNTKPHVSGISLPALITNTEGGVKIAFRADGLLKVWVSGEAYTYDAGWETDKTADGVCFTKQGSSAELNINFGPKE